MKSYEVISTLMRDGKKIFPGTDGKVVKVDLDDEEAEGLKALGAVSELVAEPAPAPAPAAPAPAQPSAAAPVVPTDPAERLIAIKAAVAKLDAADKSLFTASGKPKTEALEHVLGQGWIVSAAERDQSIDEGQ